LPNTGRGFYIRGVNQKKGKKAKAMLESLALFTVIFVKVNTAIMLVSFIVLSLVVAYEDTLPAEDE
jgi:hypothetical protein